MVLGATDGWHMTQKRYPCACCGFITLHERPPGTFEICPVCNWEDDDVQFADPKAQGGANRVSLEEARDNFRTHGAAEPEFRDRVRRPTASEMPPG